MPKILVERKDILRKPEIDEMLSKADDRLKCIIALLWIFGKRINEILRLKKEDIWTDQNFLYVRFQVSKKRSWKKTPIPETYVKKIRLEHPYVPYILNWISHVKSGFIFPGRSQARKVRVRTKYKNRKGDEVIGEYEYIREGGHLTRQRVYQLLKEINPNAWLHLFRESLATYMAERGATEEELMHWFDWSDIRTAHKYVKRGTRLIEKWAEREW